MATRVFDGIKFCAQFLKRTSKGTFLLSLVQIGPGIWEEEMFKESDDDARQTHDHLKAPLEHVVLRWANNCSFSMAKYMLPLQDEDKI